MVVSSSVQALLVALTVIVCGAAAADTFTLGVDAETALHTTDERFVNFNVRARSDARTTRSHEMAAPRTTSRQRAPLQIGTDDGEPLPSPAD